MAPVVRGDGHRRRLYGPAGAAASTFRARRGARRTGTPGAVHSTLSAHCPARPVNTSGVSGYVSIRQYECGGAFST